MAISTSLLLVQVLALAERDAGVLEQRLDLLVGKVLRLGQPVLQVVRQLDLGDPVHRLDALTTISPRLSFLM